MYEAVNLLEYLPSWDPCPAMGYVRVNKVRWPLMIVSRIHEIFTNNASLTYSMQIKGAVRRHGDDSASTTTANL